MRLCRTFHECLKRKLFQTVINSPSALSFPPPKTSWRSKRMISLKKSLASLQLFSKHDFPSILLKWVGPPPTPPPSKSFMETQQWNCSLFDSFAIDTTLRRKKEIKRRRQSGGRTTTKKEAFSHLDSKSLEISLSRFCCQRGYNNANAANPCPEVNLRSIRLGWRRPCRPPSKWLEMHHNRRFVPVDKQLRLVRKSHSCRIRNFTLSPVLSVINRSSDSSPFRIIDTFSSPGESAEGKHELINTPLTYYTSSTFCACIECEKAIKTFAASHKKSLWKFSAVPLRVAWKHKPKHLLSFDASNPALTWLRLALRDSSKTWVLAGHVQRFKFSSLIDCSACFRLENPAKLKNQLETRRMLRGG